MIATVPIALLKLERPFLDTSKRENVPGFGGGPTLCDRFCQLPSKKTLHVRNLSTWLVGS
jgi:hypothetical protein